MNVGSGEFRDAGSVSASGADASYFRQRWAYYDPTPGSIWTTMASGVLVLIGMGCDAD
jgi:hypothetical protein